MSKLILTSHGIHTPLGYRLISRELCKDNVKYKKILFITLAEDIIGKRLKAACVEMGMKAENVYIFQKEEEILGKKFDLIYVSEGNTFEMLRYIRENNLVSFIKDAVTNGADYIGASAGAYIAGLDIEPAKKFDRNRENMEDFTALGLFDGAVIPHYDPMDVKRYLAYRDARLSGKYKEVYAITDRGKEVIPI